MIRISERPLRCVFCVLRLSQPTAVRANRLNGRLSELNWTACGVLTHKTWRQSQEW